MSSCTRKTVEFFAPAREFYYNYCTTISWLLQTFALFGGLTPLPFFHQLLLLGVAGIALGTVLQRTNALNKHAQNFGINEAAVTSEELERGVVPLCYLVLSAALRATGAGEFAAFVFWFGAAFTYV